MAQALKERNDMFPVLLDRMKAYKKFSKWIDIYPKMLDLFMSKMIDAVINGYPLKLNNIQFEFVYSNFSEIHKEKKKRIKEGLNAGLFKSSKVPYYFYLNISTLSEVVGHDNFSRFYFVPEEKYAKIIQDFVDSDDVYKIISHEESEY